MLESDSGEFNLLGESNTKKNRKFGENRSSRKSPKKVGVVIRVKYSRKFTIRTKVVQYDWQIIHRVHGNQFCGANRKALGKIFDKPLEYDKQETAS